MDDASNLPFSEIELSKDERKMLKALADSRIFATDDIFQTARMYASAGALSVKSQICTQSPAKMVSLCCRLARPAQLK